MSATDVKTIWFNRTFSHIRGAMALIREADTDQHFRLLCTHNNPYFPGFLAADACALEPDDLNDEAYLKFCLTFCEENNVDLFYPGRHAAMISEHVAMFSDAGTHLCVVSNAANAKLLGDKAQFYRSHENDAVSGPEFIEVSNYGEFENAYEALRLRHPTLSIKPAHGVYGIGFRVIDEEGSAFDYMMSGSQFRVTLAELRRELKAVGKFKSLLVMEQLPGLEYSVDCLADSGRLITAIIRRKERATGAGQTILDDTTIHNTCRALAERYSLNALFNVQFKEDARGQIRLLEINGRMSGGMPMACLAGPNLPYLAICQAFGQHDFPTHALQIRHGIHVGEITVPTVLGH